MTKQSKKKRRAADDHSNTGNLVNLASYFCISFWWQGPRHRQSLRLHVSCLEKIVKWRSRINWAAASNKAAMQRKQRVSKWKKKKYIYIYKRILGSCTLRITTLNSTGRVEVKLHDFLMSTLVGGEWLNSRSIRFILWDESTGIHRTGASQPVLIRAEETAAARAGTFANHSFLLS
jgi:hypothetical protein